MQPSRFFDVKYEKGTFLLKSICVAQPAFTVKLLDYGIYQAPWVSKVEKSEAKELILES